MKTREIAHDQWVPFLDQFSEAHRGERIEVRIVSKQSGVQTAAKDLSLVGITDDFKATGGERIEVIAGDPATPHISHAVAHPIHVRIAERKDGSPVAMQIESADGSETLVRFRDPTEGPPPKFGPDN